MCLLGRVLYKVKEVPVCNYIFFSSSNFLLRLLNKCEKEGNLVRKIWNQIKTLVARIDRIDEGGRSRAFVISFPSMTRQRLAHKKRQTRKKKFLLLLLDFFVNFSHFKWAQRERQREKHKRHTILTFLYSFCSFTMANRMIISMYTLQQQQHQNTLQQSYIVLSKSQRDSASERIFPKSRSGTITNFIQHNPLPSLCLSFRSTISITVNKIGVAPPSPIYLFCLLLFFSSLSSVSLPIYSTL